MKYRILQQLSFTRDLKHAEAQGRDLDKLDEVVSMLSNGQKLPKKYKDHALTRQWKGYRDCHIEQDWLLVYKIDKDLLILELTRTGAHAELFSSYK